MLIQTLGLLLLLTGQSLAVWSHFGIHNWPTIHIEGGGSASRPGSSSSSHHKHKVQSDYDAHLSAYYSDYWQQFYQAQAAYYAYWPYGPYGGYPPYGPHEPPPTTKAPETETTTPEIPTTMEANTTSTAIPTSTEALPTTTPSPTTSTAVAPENTDTTSTAVIPPVRAHTTPLPFRWVASNLISPGRRLPLNYVRGSGEGAPALAYIPYDQLGTFIQFVGKK